MFALHAALSLALAESPTWSPAPRDRLTFSNATFVRVNPLGLIDTFRLGWQRRLSPKHTLLLKDTYTFVGGSALVTPAYLRGGVYAEAQALSVLRVFASAEAVQYFGTFDQILSWDDRGARYDDRTLAELGDQGLAAARGGWVLNAGLTLRAAAGPVAIRTTPQVTRFDLALPDGDVVFYDQYWDRLAPDAGWMWLQDTDVLVLAGEVRLGARHTFSDTIGPAAGDGSLAHHRVGPLFAWQMVDRGTSPGVNKATLFALAQWWLTHPYRTGEVSPAGLPLIAVGVSFEGDAVQGGGGR